MYLIENNNGECDKFWKRASFLHHIAKLEQNAIPYSLSKVVMDKYGNCEVAHGQTVEELEQDIKAKRKLLRTT